MVVTVIVLSTCVAECVARAVRGKGKVFHEPFAFQTSSLVARVLSSFGSAYSFLRWLCALLVFSEFSMCV